MRKEWKVCLFLIVALTATVSAMAQAQTEEKLKVTNQFKGKVFQLQYRSPRVLLPVLQPLMSTSSAAAISGSEETRTISVRDYSENLDAIEAAIRLLDKPETASHRIGLEIQISLIGASQSPAADESKMPESLVPVITQLRRTLSFKSYRYITTLRQLTLDQGRVGASGPIARFFPIPASSEMEVPGGYEYNLKDIRVIPGAGNAATIMVGEFEFIAMVPYVINPKLVEIGTQSPKIDRQRISLTTGLTLKEGEQVVVGTSSAGGEDKAIIVVVSIRRTGS